MKVKSIMAQVCKHAQRHELIPASIGQDGRPSNPVVLARCESGSSYEAIVATPEQTITLLQHLKSGDTLLEWKAALLHASTALRPGEGFGLKWHFDRALGQINIRRGWSKGKETKGKNEGLTTQVSMILSLQRFSMHGGARRSIIAILIGCSPQQSRKGRPLVPLALLAKSIYGQRP